MLRRNGLKYVWRWSLVFVFGFALLNQASAATEKYIGFWKAGSGGNKVLRFDDFQKLVEKWKELGKENYRLQDLEAVKIGNDVRYTGTWIKGNGKHAIYVLNSFKDFAAKWKELLDEKGMQLIDVEVIPQKDKNVYIGVWGTGAGGSALYQFNNWTDFVNKWNELSKSNRVLLDVEAFTVAGKTNFVGVWETGIGKEQALYKSGWNDFSKKWKELSEKGYRLKDIDLLPVKGGEEVIGVWGKDTGGHYLWVADSWEDFVAKNNEYSGKKMDLIDLAVANYGKPAQNPGSKPPASKPIEEKILTFSKGLQVRKDTLSGIEFPVDMPAIVYPKFEGCGAADRLAAIKAWAMAHHHAWRALQLFDFLAKSGKSREALWSDGYTAKNLEERKVSWSPYAWFGEYSDDKYRFDYIHQALRMNFEKRYLVKNTIKCRRDDDGAHPCYLKNPGTDNPPSANHIVAGTINLCNRFFDGKNETDQIRTILHEGFHWLAPKGLAILDTQTHSDKNKNGICATDTEKMYGKTNAIHLASAKGCWGNPKLHRGMAARNNDNYAYFILLFGSAVYSKQLDRFPVG